MLASRLRIRLVLVQLAALLLTLFPTCAPTGAPTGAPPAQVASSARFSIGPPAAAPPAATAKPRTSSRSSQAVQPIPLAGPLAEANAEVSGLEWHGDDLILLPQHPFRLSGSNTYGLVFALSRPTIEAFLRGSRTEPLRPRPLVLQAPGLATRIPSYQGFEALAFRGDRAYLAVEAVADAATGAMRGLLFAGRLRGDTLRLDPRRRATLPPQTKAGNMAYEALLSAAASGPPRVLGLYEANGRNVNPRPRAPVFSAALRPLQTLPFPALEYRLTDATALDAEGRFWVMNYFFPGERALLRPAPDPLAAPTSDSTYDDGAFGASERPVERLVEFRLGEAGFRRTTAPPLYLALQPGTPRNWEGLARLPPAGGEGEAGFLLITDQYPETLLSFVSAPTDGP